MMSKSLSDEQTDIVHTLKHYFLLDQVMNSLIIRLMIFSATV